MRRSISWILSLVILASIGPARSQELADIVVEVQVVTLPRAKAIPLVHALKDESTAAGAYADVQKLLLAGTAKLIGWPTVTTRSGERATTEDVTEVRYATEFDTGKVEVYLKGDDWNAVQQPTALAASEITAVPAAFETRNTGVTLEVEPVFSDDLRVISLNVACQHVSFKGMRKVVIERAKDGQKMICEQPEFTANKVYTSLLVQSTSPILLGTFAASGEPDHLELFLLRAQVRVMPAK